MSSEISAYIRQHATAVAPLHKDYSLKYWDLSLSGDEERERALVAAKERYVKVYNNREEFRQLQEWRRSKPQLLEVEERQLKLIWDSFVPNQIPEETLLDMVARETRIENLFNTFRANFEGRNATDNDLRDVLKEESVSERRRSAWEASKQVGREVHPQLMELVRIRNREARRLGYQDYHAMMFELQELDRNWVFSLFDRLEALSEPAFVSMKAELDADLKRDRGMEDAPSYPWLYSDPFFQEYPDSGGESLNEIFRDQDIEELTRKHFRGIGLNIDDIMSRADLYEREGKSQHAFCLDVDREGDVRVLCNVRKDERWMSTMLHEFGHAVYDKFNNRSLPFLLRTPAHILTTEAIAMLNGRMTKDPEWLEKVRGLTTREAQSVSAAAGKAQRSEMLIFLRWGLTLTRFERELYREPDQDLNRLWRTLVERIQKVTYPPDRDLPDWAAKSHLATAPAYYQNYILGELMASQLLNYIERETLKAPGYVERSETGAYLRKAIFEPGALFPWNDMLHRATGESLNPEHFVRQFV
ncbi:MAG TPA: M2 family metallopeptidase [Terriglobia bacterium]|nr:M2 family metallopeptidase [Terriglobia bacterium]